MDCAPADNDNTPGKCFDSVVSECVGAQFITHRCPGATSKCCPTPGTVKRKANLPAMYTIPGLDDMCFPLAQGDFTMSDGPRTITGFITPSSFSQNRATDDHDHPRRCHKGLDLFTGGVDAHRMTKGQVLAIAPGKVTAIMKPFTTCKDGWVFDANGANGHRVTSGTQVYGITVNHPGINQDVVYGELTSHFVKVGQDLVKGHLIGFATACEMLHFELWDKGTRGTGHWGPAGDTTSTADCCPADDSVPSFHGLKNPRALLRMLQGKWCTPVVVPQPA